MRSGRESCAGMIYIRLGVLRLSVSFEYCFNSGGGPENARQRKAEGSRGKEEGENAGGRAGQKGRLSRKISPSVGKPEGLAGAGKTGGGGLVFGKVGR